MLPAEDPATDATALPEYMQNTVNISEGKSCCHCSAVTSSFDIQSQRSSRANTGPQRGSSGEDFFAIRPFVQDCWS